MAGLATRAPTPVPAPRSTNTVINRPNADQQVSHSTITGPWSTMTQAAPEPQTAPQAAPSFRVPTPVAPAPAAPAPVAAPQPLPAAAPMQALGAAAMDPAQGFQEAGVSALNPNLGNRLSPSALMALAQMAGRNY